MARHGSERDSYVRNYAMVDQGQVRQRMEAAIESLLALLDELDGDADRENGHDAEAVDEDGDPCDQGEPETFFPIEPWEGFRAGLGATR